MNRLEFPRNSGRTYFANNLYKAACEYMAKTELYDRSLTDMRSPHDPTEAWLVLDYERGRSNAYALSLRIEVSKKYCVTPFELGEEIGRHRSYSAQMWIDEYERLQGGEQAE